MDSKNLSDRPHSFSGAIGIARKDITPPVGVYSRNWGAAKHDVATSIHRSLTLTALAISAESTHESPLVLIDADLGWWKTPETFNSFHARILEELELSPEQLIFALSHTHAGPPLMEVDASLPGSDLLSRWLEDLYHHTLAAVREAIAGRFSAILEWQTGHCDLAAVRDLPGPNPTHNRIVCGFNPAGHPDNTLLVGRVTDTAGVVRATLVNYACHPTTLAWDNSAISPDYVGAMRETMQSVTGAPAIFLLGACGDLAPKYQYVGDPAVADRHGRQLGYAALAVLNGMEPPRTQLVYRGVVESGAPLAVWEHEAADSPRNLRAKRTVVELVIKDWPSAEELERQRLACSDRALEERIRRKRDIRRGLGDEATFGLPIYIWRIGDTVWVGCCCEPYSELQLELRRRFSNCTIVCMNLINGSIGYLPPSELYDSDIYPVWQTPFERGSLEATLAKMTEAIGDVLGK